MIVVADTSPLNYLIRLGHAEVLESLYGRITVPPAGLIEMRHPDAPPEVRAWAVASPSWIERMSVQRLDPTLPEELGIGEREAISLAIEHRADLPLIDDKAGRQAAWDRQIELGGTLAVLLQAALLGHLELPDALNQLLGFGFRASPRVIAALLSVISSYWKAGKGDGRDYSFGSCVVSHPPPSALINNTLASI